MEKIKQTRYFGCRFLWGASIISTPRSPDGAKFAHRSHNLLILAQPPVTRRYLENDMLDAFGIGSANKKAQKSAADDLQQLVNSAREERSALSEMLTQVTMRASKLAQTQKKPRADREDTAPARWGKVDELGARLTSLDERTKAMEDVDKKIKNLGEDSPPGATAAERVVGPKATSRSIARPLKANCPRRRSRRTPPRHVEKGTCITGRAPRDAETHAGDLKNSLDSASALKRSRPGARGRHDSRPGIRRASARVTARPRRQRGGDGSGVKGRREAHGPAARSCTSSARNRRDASRR